MKGLIQMVLKRARLLVIVLAVVYLAIGIAFGALAGQAESSQARAGWRLAAWALSALAFAAHIGHEHFRLRSTTMITAWHASLAAALGAFGLAAAANVRSLVVGTGNRTLLTIALVAWPVVTLVPAFVVAFVAATGLARVGRSGA